MNTAQASSLKPVPNAVVFDDARIASSSLSPLTDLRAAFHIRTGALTTLERLERDTRVRLAAWSSSDRLRELSRERSSLPSVRDATITGELLLLNGRCPMPPDRALSLRFNEALIEDSSGDIIAARTDASRLDAIIAGDHSGLKVHTHTARALISRPWHVRTFRDACIAHDLALLLAQCERGTQSTGTLILIGEPNRLSIHASAKIAPGVVLDVENGPIVVAEHAIIRPGAILVGPCYIGPHTTVLERTLIKPNTAIGPHCKVAGEIGGTIFQGFSNKAHDGHLGDSYLGEWVNLGAGTTNSNLLNTYGEVICKPFNADRSIGSNERTGETFLGCILGDHVKAAICTRIMTGAIVGTGTMWAATAPIIGTVPAFSWVTDGEGLKPGIKPYRFEKFVEVAKAAMGRRKIAPSRAYTHALRHLAEPI